MTRLRWKLKQLAFERDIQLNIYAILETLENLKSAVYDKKGGIFLDFSKVFDTINHNILLGKL